MRDQSIEPSDPRALGANGDRSTSRWSEASDRLLSTLRVLAPTLAVAFAAVVEGWAWSDRVTTIAQFRLAQCFVVSALSMGFAVALTVQVFRSNPRFGRVKASRGVICLRVVGVLALSAVGHFAWTPMNDDTERMRSQVDTDMGAVAKAAFIIRARNGIDPSFDAALARYRTLVYTSQVLNVSSPRLASYDAFQAGARDWITTCNSRSAPTVGTQCQDMDTWLMDDGSSHYAVPKARALSQVFTGGDLLVPPAERDALAYLVGDAKPGKRARAI